MLTDLVAAVAAARPDDEALTDGRERLTWAGYERRIVLLAAALAMHGVRHGDRVGILTPKSVVSFVAVHAAQRIGAVVVPVDWFAPEAHVASVLTDAGAVAVVGLLDDAHRAMVPPGLVVVDPREIDDHADGGRLPDPPEPDDPAYIIYTSGSTGRPKGIVHTHASALAYARLAAATYGLTPADRTANIAPLHFDQSTFELYAAPLAGSAAIVVPDAVVKFPASLARLLETERASVLYTVPYVIRQLVERGGAAGRDLSAMRWVKYGGESFPPAALGAAMTAIPTARFSNVYGPAEVNQCTYHHVTPTTGPLTADDAVPIGRPWDGVHLVVVDPDTTAETDPGVPGELWVSGPTTMRGYWGRPDLDERALVRRPGDARLWYRTGDLVRHGDDGALVFLGRIDHQVKLRGQRIELEAVDAVLLEHPSVEAAASFVVRADGAEDELVALVAPRVDDDVLDDLADRCRRRLPRYAVPSRIEGRDTLPRTSSGKVDRGAAAAGHRTGTGPTGPS